MQKCVNSWALPFDNDAALERPHAFAVKRQRHRIHVAVGRKQREHIALEHAQIAGDGYDEYSGNMETVVLEKETCERLICTMEQR